MSFVTLFFVATPQVGVQPILLRKKEYDKGVKTLIMYEIH